MRHGGFAVYQKHGEIILVGAAKRGAIAIVGVISGATGNDSRHPARQTSEWKNELKPRRHFVRNAWAFPPPST